MKTLITALIIICFLESTILPLDLCLIILICRSYLKTERENLYLAFGFGILKGLLTLTSLGFISVLYLIFVSLTEGLSKTRLAGNPLLIIPITFIILCLNQIALSFFTHQSLHLFPKVFLESFLSLPLFYIVRLWEERYIFRKEIKLKL